jgi:hypothetical protein
MDPSVSPRAYTFSGHWAPAPGEQADHTETAGAEVVFNLGEHADISEHKHTDEPEMKIKPATAR